MPNGPLLPPFTSGSVRSILRSDFGLGMFRQYSGAKILETLRDQGMGIRTQDFYNIRRDMLGLGKYQEQLKTLRSETLIPRGWMDDRGDINLHYKVQYRADMLLYDPDTGERSIISRAIGSDVQYGKGEIMSIFSGVFSSFLENYNLQVEDIELTEVWVQPGSGLVLSTEIY